MRVSLRWFRWALVGLVLLGVGLFLFRGRVAAWLGLGSTPPADKPPAAKILERRPIEVVPGIYYLGKSVPSAVYVVDTSDGLVLIDSGLEADAALVKSQLAELHLDIGRLRAILLTHVHADHSQGAEHLRQLTGAKVYAGRGDCPTLRAGRPPESFLSIFYYETAVTLHPTTVDVELAGDEVLSFGADRFTVLATPGHTAGSVCYLLERSGRRILFTGDVVMKLTDAGDSSLGTYAAHLAPIYGGNAQDYLASLRLLRQLPTPDLVFPGHPRKDFVPPSPQLPAERWREMLDKGIAEMEQVLQRHANDGANFLDGHAKELRPGLHYWGECGDSAVYTVDTPRGLLLFDAPGGAALAPFLAGKKPAIVLLTSADPQTTAGLADLVRSSGCQVVAPRAALEQIRGLCPAGTSVLPAEDFDKSGWLEGVRAIGLKGRGRSPSAYEFRWAGKDVIVSGRIPVWLDGPSEERLFSAVTGPEGSVKDYLDTLDQLKDLSPDVWLPAEPVQGQNANLYGDFWKKSLERNRDMLLERAPPF